MMPTQPNESSDIEWTCTFRMLLKLTRKEEEEKKNDITIDMLQPCR